MKAWQLNSPKNLEKANLPELERKDNKVKVKIMRARLSDADVAVYSSGIDKIHYPIIPGRFAIGQIIEASENSYLKKGDKVYLSDILEDECAPNGLQIAGETTNGYYRDFALMNEDEVYDLPQSVSDEAAFLIDAVAQAEHIVDELNITVGQHVLVMGGGLYGNILCQILMYHRAVPILADNNVVRLDRAQKSGIYYTYPDDESLKNNILKITGGNLADAAIYLPYCNRKETSIVFSFIKHGAPVAFFSTVKKDIIVNLKGAIENNNTIKTISESREFIPTAINLLANKAVIFSEFKYNILSDEKIPQLLSEYAQKVEEGIPLPEDITIFKFIF